MSSGKRLTEGDPEELIECPFDPVHMLRRKRMPYHIMKCRENHNKRDYVYCTFNYRHVMPKHALEAHLQVCEDRLSMESELVQKMQGENEVSTLKGYTGIPASTFRPPDPEESWDDSNVVVNIAADYSGENNELMSYSEPSKRPLVKEPPNPRMPAMSSTSSSEVFKLATTSVPGAGQSPERPRGRGRGRGTLSSSPSAKVGGLNGEASPPSMPVGRGRGLLRQPVASAATERSEALEKARKDQRKLKKMLKQILELEDRDITTLNQDQKDKLARKSAVLDKLGQLTEFLESSQNA